MTDDIVTRLRNYDFMRDGDTPELTMAEAADEIERLRAEVVRLGSFLHPIGAVIHSQAVSGD